MEKRSVALVFGGEGDEREVSLTGARFVCPLIDRNKYEVLPTLITKDGEWLLTPDRGELTDLSGGERVFPTRRGFATPSGFLPVDCAIPLLHGERGEDGIIQGLLDAAAIPYVGSAVTAGAVSMDKAFTKALVNTLGIPTVRSYLVITDSKTHSPKAVLARAEAEFGYPMFIKPARQGSSVGAARADSRADFYKALRAADAVSDGRILVEEYIDNRVELECAYLGACGKQLFTPLGQITCKGFYDYEEKYSADSSASVASHSPHEAAFGEKIREWSLKIVELLGVKHLSRLDYFLSDGRLYFNEINTFPGFTGASLYPRLVERLGISPRELVDLLISDAVGV